MSPGPSSRAVDWSILVVVLLQAATGTTTIFVGVPSSAWLVTLHAIGGLVLVGLIGLKLLRVSHHLRPGRFRPDMTASVAAAAMVLATLGSGVAWATGWRPWVGPWTLLTVHALLGLGLLVPVAFHLRHRIHRPRQSDFADRRTALQLAALAGLGAVAWNLQRWLVAVLETPSRFTGSYETRSFEGNAFPTTSWVADAPDPVDKATWELTVDGAVESELALSEGALDPTHERAAVLDCTSGWYSNQRWQGVRVESLLEAAGATDRARWISFHSVTGYRWSLPIEEAREALLATHVTGERLSHAHGYPLRLVAPGRRGFQWVKWVERVEVRTSPDWGQWIAIFTSGFD